MILTTKQITEIEDRKNEFILYYRNGNEFKTSNEVDRVECIGINDTETTITDEDGLECLAFELVQIRIYYINESVNYIHSIMAAEIIDVIVIEPKEEFEIN